MCIDLQGKKLTNAHTEKTKIHPQLLPRSLLKHKFQLLSGSHYFPEHWNFNNKDIYRVSSFIVALSKLCCMICILWMSLETTVEENTRLLDYTQQFMSTNTFYFSGYVTCLSPSAVNGLLLFNECWGLQSSPRHTYIMKNAEICQFP